MQDPIAGYDVQQTRDVPNYLAALVKRKEILIIGTAVCILLTTITVVLLPDIYESSAILLVAPPRFSPELRPSVLSVQTYQKLLLNKTMVADMLAKIRKMYPKEFKDVKTPDLAAALDVEINKEGKRSGEDYYSPLLVLKAEHKNKVIAKDMVEIWMKLFEEQIRRIMEEQVKETEEFISDQFTAYKKNLKTAEKKRREYVSKKNVGLMRKKVAIKTSVLEGVQIDLESARKSYENKKHELERVVEKIEAVTSGGRCGIYPSVELKPDVPGFNDFQKEFRREILDKKNLYIEKHAEKLKFLSENDIPFEKRVKDEYKLTAISQKSELMNIDLRLKTLAIQLQETDKELKESEKKEVLLKAPADHVLWGLIRSKPSKKELGEFMREWHMKTEVLNPVYSNLMNKKVDLMIEQNTLKGKRKLLEDEIKKNEKQMTSLSDKINVLEHQWHLLSLEFDDARSEFSRLEGYYGTLLTRKGQLLTEVHDGLRSMMDLREKAETMDNEIMNLYERIYIAEDEIKDLDREVERHHAVYNQFKNKIEAAKIAKAEIMSEIKTAAMPSVPDKKIKPKRMTIVMIAGLLGFILSCMLALFLDFLDRYRDEFEDKMEPAAQTGGE